MPSPVTVGWSGIEDKNMSKWFLNKSTCPQLVLLSFSGKRLKIWAPLTPSDLSLAFLMTAGAALTNVFVWWSYLSSPSQKWTGHHTHGPSLCWSSREILFCISLSSPLLWKKMEFRELFPIKEANQLWTPYPVCYLLLNLFLLIDWILFRRWPQLGAIAKSRLG